MNVLKHIGQARALGTSDAAIYCGISEDLLSRGRYARGSHLNVPPHTRIGARVVYLREDLDTWLERCRSVTANSRSQS